MPLTIPKPLAERMKSKSIPQPNGCIHFAHKKNGGYGVIQIRKKKSRLAHRVAYELAKGSIPEGMCVLHRCDNPICVNVDHLFLGTRADNNADKVAKNRQSRAMGMPGEKHPGAKLKDSDILKIRADQRPQTKIAADYGVSQSKICHIKTGKNWRHVQGP